VKKLGDKTFGGLTRPHLKLIGSIVAAKQIKASRADRKAHEIYLRERKLPGTPRHAALPPLYGCQSFHHSLSPMIVMTAQSKSARLHTPEVRLLSCTYGLFTIAI
jgi:hypothetical protein